MGTRSRLWAGRTAGRAGRSTMLGRTSRQLGLATAFSSSTAQAGGDRQVTVDDRAFGGAGGTTPTAAPSGSVSAGGGGAASSVAYGANSGISTVSTTSNAYGGNAASPTQSGPAQRHASSMATAIGEGTAAPPQIHPAVLRHCSTVGAPLRPPPLPMAPAELPRPAPLLPGSERSGAWIDMPARVLLV